MPGYREALFMSDILETKIFVPFWSDRKLYGVTSKVVFNEKSFCACVIPSRKEFCVSVFRYVLHGRVTMEEEKFFVRTAEKKLLNEILILNE